ncbi:MAG TPA: HAMP domain-containing sensor histidine kinase [Chryseosolibacter sp.]
MSHENSFVSPPNSLANWRYFLSYKSKRSHTLMAWCGVFIFPVFTLLDYLVLDDWELFLIVRLAGALAIVLILVANERFNFSSEFIAHFSCHVVFISLMWMLSWLKTPDQFFIYALNASTAYIASSIFLLWQPRHSIIIVSTTLASLSLCCFLFSPLSFSDIASHGLLVLMTIIVMTQLYVHYRYTVTFRDFVRQLELNHAYEELKLKNFEINQRNFEVLQQKEKLEELNALKDRLFMIISHDFRSPLHSLKGLIVLLNDSDLISPDEFKMLLKGLKHNVDQTYDLLENLLIWSKSQMKGFYVRQEDIDARELVSQNSALLQSVAEKKSINIINNIEEGVMVRGDMDMIRLVLRNLISNALKFTEKSGTVTVRSAVVGKSVTISVSDTGIGMDARQKNHAFVHGLSKNGTHEEKGTGLGLMICKEFVEKNNGKIWVESEKGKGSTFTFSLPAAEHSNVKINASQASSR